MRRISVLIPFVLSAVASAQQPSLTCHSDVGAYVSVFGNQVLNFIPKSTAITKLTVVQAKSTSNYFPRATTTVTPTISGRTATFLFREEARILQGYKSKAGTATRTADRPHSWLLKVPASSAGNVLVLEVKSVLSQRFFAGIAQLDIGNNGTLEVNHDVSQKGRLTQAFNLGTKAVDIRIVTLGGRRFNSNYAGAYDFQVGLTLNPDAPIKVSSYGPMCGMKLSVSGVVNGSGHKVSFKIEGGFPTRGAMLMLGVNPTAIQFPGTPCTVLVNPLMTPVFRDFNGICVFDLHVPGRIDGLIYLQAVSMHSAFGYTSFRMSNGIKVDGR